MIDLREQVKHELAETRKELHEICKDATQEEYVWEPRPGMKSIKAQLEECGVMEKLHIHLLETGEMLEWQTAITWSGDDVASMFKDLEKIRADTIAFIDGCADDAWLSVVDIPEKWQQWWGKQRARESLTRWVERHEYYHLGQIISIRWMQGYNPYDES